LLKLLWSYMVRDRTAKLQQFIVAVQRRWGARALRLGRQPNHAIPVLSTGDHSMAHYRAWLDQHGVQTSATLETSDDGQHLKIAGLCIVADSQGLSLSDAGG
jgi:hypothetical protein